MLAGCRHPSKSHKSLWVPAVLDHKKFLVVFTPKPINAWSKPQDTNLWDGKPCQEACLVEKFDTLENHS